jgi:tRNA (uracil-5-)-methyltransferase TRM9
VDPDREPSVADVRATYDRIAPHFDETRQCAWPAVERFCDEHAGVLGLAVGCGNGRHLPHLAARVDRCVGLDLSRGVLDTAREAAAATADEVPTHLVQGAATGLPHRDGAVDVALHVATLHHLPTRDARIDALDELARVLGPDGHALVSAWSVTHTRFDADAAFDGWIDWTLPSGETVPRFYHVYDPTSFAEDLGASACAVERTFEEAGNCFGVVTGVRNALAGGSRNRA